MIHIMLDLETWGTRPGCAIRSIGAAIFDPDAEHPIHEAFGINIDTESCKRYGLHIDKETAEWWSKQDETARVALEVDPKPVGEALPIFHKWYVSHKPLRVWSHGAGFDIPIYDAVAQSIGMTVPWNYRDIRDTRTLYDAAEFGKAEYDAIPFVGTPHVASIDAVHQAKCVIHALSRLSSLKTKSRPLTELAIRLDDRRRTPSGVRELG